MPFASRKATDRATPHATVEPLFTKRLLADQTEAYNYSSIVYFFFPLQKSKHAHEVYMFLEPHEKN
jgi:hypothetical protein